MSFLAPGALIWLGSIPVLIWLWRFAATKRQIRIPSLIPFEHLLKRAPTRRTRLVVTLLFWLQLAALLGLATALARPVLFRPRAKTMLAVLDTSASMGAVRRGQRAFDEARRALLARIARKAPADQWLVVTTSPVAPLTPQPTGDAAALSRAVEALRASHLGGSLSTAAHIGRMLLGGEPDETVVVTDEARPAELSGDRLRWVTVGEELPNVAIVGLDAQGPLCSASEASVAATVQNFSDEPAEVVLAATQGGRRLAKTRAQFAPRARQSLSLTVPEGTEGWVELSLAADGDALDVDDRAWVNVSRGAAVPIAVRSDTASFKETISEWLGACEALTWSLDAPSDTAALVITDREEQVTPSAIASMVFYPPASGRAALNHWIVSAGHPIGSYLAPVEVVAARLNVSSEVGTSGAVVVAALVGGRQVPVVMADERDGRRTVAMRLDPSASRGATPVLLAFFNSLRWLMGRSAVETTGEPLRLGAFTAGRVSVRRPDGSTERLETDGGALVYEATPQAGLYRFSQGATEVTAAVNFFDPLESNLMERASTWRTNRDRFSFPVGREREKGSGPGTVSSLGRAAQPLSRLLMGLVLAVLLFEWWCYTRGTASLFPTTPDGKKGNGPGTVFPLRGRRKWLAIGGRAVALGALAAALWGAPRHRTLEAPRHLVYLVDGSASIDARQREWMARRLASLEALRPPPLERAVVAFGADAHVASPFGQERLTDVEAIRAALARSGVNPEQTNVEAALLSVPGLLSSRQPSAAPGTSQAGRVSVVLLSDGRETSGNVTGVLAAVRRLGLAVFPAPPPLFSEVRTVWEELAVPPVVQQGSPVAIQLVVVSGAARPKPAVVSIDLHGVRVKQQRMTVRPGWQVLHLDVPAIGRGTMALDVHLAIPDEGLREQRRAYTEVEGPPHLLLVTERPATLPILGTALKRREMELSMIRVEDLPSDDASPVGRPALSNGAGGVSRLLDYDAILLFNVPKSSLSAGQVGAMRAYVERFGGGLVTVGLGGDLAHEVQTPSPLDALLPVQFEPKGLREAKRRVCMVLLIDRSASMLGPRIAATKRAAVALVNQLSPDDLVGILAFDTQPYVVAEVQQAGQVGPSLVEKLVKLRSSGGTDVYPALTAAADRLELTGATLKHIILLSDGNTPFHRQAYNALAASLRQSGTTVSTIGIGAAFINTDYLEWLAASTGGTFYQMRQLEELPQLVARDTQQEMERLPFTEGRFRPAKTPTTDWFSDTSDWPTLRGYLTSTARPGSRLDLTVDGGEGEEPLLARWTMGRGRVVSFTSDADARWSPEWIRWPGFEGAWAQVVRWAMRPRVTEELFVWVDEGRGIPQVVVEGALHDPRGALLDAAGGSALPLSLVQTGAWRWHASLEQVPSGWYQVALESQHATEEGATVFAKRWVQVGTPPASQELAGQPPREGLLRQLASATSGAYDAPDAALVPPTATVTVTEPLFTWWLPLVIVALLIDIAARGSSML